MNDDPTMNTKTVAVTTILVVLMVVRLLFLLPPKAPLSSPPLLFLFIFVGCRDKKTDSVQKRHCMCCVLSAWFASFVVLKLVVLVATLFLLQIISSGVDKDESRCLLLCLSYSTR